MVSLDQPDLADQGSEHEGAYGGKQKSEHDCGQRRLQAGHELAGIEALVERHDDLARRREHEIADLEPSARQFPAADDEHGEQRHQEHLRLQPEALAPRRRSQGLGLFDLVTGDRHLAFASIDIDRKCLVPSCQHCSYSIAPRLLSSFRMRVTSAPNFGEVMISKLRGRGMSTVRTSASRPGREVMTADTVR